MDEHDTPVQFEVQGIHITPKPPVASYREVAGLIMRSINQAQLLDNYLVEISRLENLVTQKDLELSEALTDSLTGLPNREVFDQEFPRVMRRNRTNIGLLLMDIDGLKRANSLGYAKGDQLLQLLARSTQGQLRVLDKMYRIGGDEFAVILENFTMPDEPALFSERFEELFAQAIPIEQFPAEMKLGVSVGCGTLEPDETPQDFFNRVDKITSERKRNRYEKHGIIFNDYRMLPPPAES
ncbi:MAG: hypothetical protein NVS1B7_0350 [Candidatus Saccharimonadales bacterium]